MYVSMTGRLHFKVNNGYLCIEIKCQLSFLFFTYIHAFQIVGNEYVPIVIEYIFFLAEEEDNRSISKG